MNRTFSAPRVLAASQLDGLRIPLFKVGVNETSHGPIILDPEVYPTLLQHVNGVDRLGIDIEHLSLDEKADPLHRGYVGYWTLQLEDGVFYATDIEWNSQLREKLEQDPPAFRWVSPALEIDSEKYAETGEQFGTSFLNFALTGLPATINAQPFLASLFAGSTTNKDTVMATKKKNPKEDETAEGGQEGNDATSPNAPNEQPEPAKPPAPTPTQPAKQPGEEAEPKKPNPGEEHGSDNDQHTDPSAKLADSAIDNMSPDEAKDALRMAMELSAQLKAQVDELLAKVAELEKAEPALDELEPAQIAASLVASGMLAKSYEAHFAKKSRKELLAFSKTRIALFKAPATDRKVVEFSSTGEGKATVAAPSASNPSSIKDNPWYAAARKAKQ